MSSVYAGIEIMKTRSSLFNQLIVRHGYLLILLFFILLPFGSTFLLPVLVLLLVGCVTAWDMMHVKQIKRREKLYFLLALCIVAPMFAALPDAISFDESMRKAVTYIAYLFAGLGILHCLREDDARRKLLMAVGVLLTLWTFDALWQYISGYNVFGFEFNEGRLTGVFYPKQRIGIVMAILTGLYFEFLRYFSLRFPLVWLLGLAYIAVIILAGSRTSWVMLAIAMIIYTLFLFKTGTFKRLQKRTVLASSAVLISLLIFVQVSYPSGFTRVGNHIATRLVELKPLLNGTLDGTGAIQARIEIWEAGLRLSKEHLVNGIGVRGFRYADIDQIEAMEPVISERYALNTHPHLIFLEVLIETGLIGLIAYLMFFASLCWLLIRSLSIGGETAYCAWLIPVFIATFPINMHKSFYGNFSSMLIWVLLSLAIASLPIERQSKLDN